MDVDTGMEVKHETAARAARMAAAPADPWAGRRVHMIGIGGCGMSGAARILHESGADVAGTDMASFDDMTALVASGIRVAIGHRAEALHPGADLVVISAAIPPSNPELAAAVARGARVLKYAELLGEIMACREGMAIAGTHGKSTTTAMCAHVFREAGADPSYLVGAMSPQLGGNSAAGRGPHFIVESCEFDRSFLHLRPHMAAVLNVEPDHLDCYRDMEDIVEAFSAFCGQVDPDGALVVNGDDPAAVRAAEAARCRTVRFGLGPGAHWRAVNLVGDGGRFAFDVRLRGEYILHARLSVAGVHNVSNALAVTALAREAGLDPEAIAAGLASYEGITRRMHHRGEGGGVTVLDDYAHHPTEIRVTLEAARARYGPRRLLVVFQPHQYSRTRHFLEEFAGAFELADEVIVPDIYRARERQDELGRVGSEELVARIRGRGVAARYLPSLPAVTEHVMAHAAEGDLVLTMGAGDVYRVADELVERICRVD